MIVFNSMVQSHPFLHSSAFLEGPPLTHLYPYPTYYFDMADTSEDLVTPSSPNSIQSDSDNSISSTDITPNPIVSKIKQATSTKKTEIKCGWYQCGLWFNSLDLLANHVSKAHSSSGPSGLFYCGWEGCSRNNKGFNARYKMLVHVRTHTNEKPHQCCLCEKSFSRAENLKIHSRSHSGEKPYVCPVPGCKKAYSNSSDRFKHTRTHQVEKPYLCKVPGCPKRYTDPSSLRKHVKTYKHFVCEQTIKTEVTQNNVINVTNNDSLTATKIINPYFKSKEENNIYLKNENNIIYANNTYSCACHHNCCLKNCLSKAAELLKLSSLINLNKTDINCGTWNRLLDPLVQQTRNICMNYKEEKMEIDVPLDLTVHPKLSH